MPLDLSDPLASLDELERWFESKIWWKIGEVRERLGDPHERVYLCRENGRVYRRKPRKCADFVETTAEELAFRDVKEVVRRFRAVLEGWRWIITNCGAVLGKLGARMYVIDPPALHFDGGVIYVFERGGEPEIVAVVHDRSPDVGLLLDALELCPYSVRVEPRSGNVI